MGFHRGRGPSLPPERCFKSASSNSKKGPLRTGPLIFPSATALLRSLATRFLCSYLLLALLAFLKLITHKNRAKDSQRYKQ